MPFQAVAAKLAPNAPVIFPRSARGDTIPASARTAFMLLSRQLTLGALFLSQKVRSVLAITWTISLIQFLGVTPAEAAVATDAVNTAYHAIYRRAEVKPSETVFLFGLGGLGFNALQIVHAIGARVIVSDIREQRLKEARQLGIPEHDIVPVDKAPQEFIKELGVSIDTVLDFVGTHQTFEDAQHIVRRGGKLLCIGSLDTENTIHMKLGTRKRLSYIFSYGGQVKDLKLVLDLIARGTIRPQVDVGRLQDFPKVLKELEDGTVNGRIALLHE